MTARFQRGPLVLDGRALRAWLLVVPCVALIAVASGDSFSAQQTSRYLEPLLRWLFGEVSPGTVLAVRFAIRKSAHVLEYAALALLVYRAARLSLRTELLWHAALALALAGGVAAWDESSQGRSAHRSGRPRDVALDLTGAALGLCCAAWLRRRPGGRRWFPPAEGADD